MSFISMFRVITLSLSLLLGLIVLGLTAHWIEITVVVAESSPAGFEIVALIAGFLTLIFVPMMLVVGQIRRGAFPSMIAVELPVLTILWVLFLATGALTAQIKDIAFPSGCGFFLPPSQGWCQEFLAIMGCSFVAWIFLFLYTVTLLVFAVVGQSRGNIVWTTSVAEAAFFKQNGGFPQQAGGAPMYIPQPAAAYPQVQPQHYPMMQQYPGPVPGNNGLPEV